jgi:predicted nucleic acid-binding protein
MTASVIVDAGFLVALLSGRDANHGWAAAQAARLPPPWTTCEASVAEAFRLLGPTGASGLRALLERRAATCTFHFGKELAPVLKLMAKHAPMSFEDACLVRMTETLSDPIVLTTDADFRNYRRLGRKAVPCVTPGQMAAWATTAGKDGKDNTGLDDILKDVSRIFRD